MDEVVTKGYLNLELAKLSGEIETRFNKRFDAMEQKFDDKFDQLFTLMDGFAKRVDDDDIERAAISSQLSRHDVWIGRLANKTQTKLRPGR